MNVGPDTRSPAVKRLTENDQIEGQLTESKPPSRIEMAKMEAEGCAKIRGRSEIELKMDQRWTHDEATEFFKKLFPRAFKHAERNLKHVRRTNRYSVPLWVLVNKEKGYFEIVPKEQPDGDDLCLYRGRPRASVVESQIYLGQNSRFEFKDLQY